MKFEVLAKYKKQVWSNEKSKLFIFEEQYKDITREWAVFAESSYAPESGSLYLIQGFVSKNKSKKFFDERGQAGSEFSFTALSMDLQDNTYDKDSQEDVMRF